MLPTEIPIDVILDMDQKDYFFETFPMKWRKKYGDTKTTDFYSATVEDIMKFMKQKKQNLDQEDKQRQKKDQNPNKRSRKEEGPSWGRFWRPRLQ